MTVIFILPERMTVIFVGNWEFVGTWEFVATLEFVATWEDDSQLVLKT
jgi:hypothetical protein